jgi:hypothetical protein
MEETRQAVTGAKEEKSKQPFPSFPLGYGNDYSL